MSGLEDDNCAPTDLSRTESVGLAFFTEAGVLSATSLAVLLVLIARNIRRYRKYAKGYKWSLVSRPADVYVLSLIIADILQSIGTVMSARWVHVGTVTAGSYCTAQGIFQQLGETSVGLATIFIAIQTFVTVWMQKQHRVRTAVIIVSVAWIFMALFVGIASGRHRNYDEPTPFWCWVGPNYKAERLFGEYFWLWLAIFVAIATYVPLFMWSRGYFTIDSEHWWKIYWAKNAPETARTQQRVASLKLLAYPVAYSIVVLPLSVVRWITFSEQTCGRSSSVPSAATFAAVFLHGCFGFVNVLLLLTTRPTLLLFDDPRRPNQLRLRRAVGSQGALLDWDPEARVSGIGSVDVGRDSQLQHQPSTLASNSRFRFPSRKRATSLDSSHNLIGVANRDNSSVILIAPSNDSVPLPAKPPSAWRPEYEGNTDQLSQDMDVAVVPTLRQQAGGLADPSFSLEHRRSSSGADVAKEMVELSPFSKSISYRKDPPPR